MATTAGVFHHPDIYTPSRSRLKQHQSKIWVIITRYFLGLAVALVCRECRWQSIRRHIVHAALAAWLMWVPNSFRISGWPHLLVDGESFFTGKIVAIVYKLTILILTYSIEFDCREMSINYVFAPNMFIRLTWSWAGRLLPYVTTLRVPFSRTRLLARVTRLSVLAKIDLSRNGMKDGRTDLTISNNVSTLIISNSSHIFCRQGLLAQKVYIT